MAPPRFLDTNILLRYFTRSDPEKAARARALLERVERRQEKVITSPLVVFETVFTLERTYKVSKSQVREMVKDVLSLHGVQLSGKGLCLQALDVYAHHNISFADAYTAAYMQSLKLSEIYSWDTDFDKLPGLSRVEPAEELG